MDRPVRDSALTAVSSSDGLESKPTGEEGRHASETWRIRTLVVDDSEMDREWIASQLAQMTEYDPIVERASSIEEAKELLETSVFDVALIDYQLGPGFGDEVIAHLDQTQKLCAAILVSGHDMSEVSLYGARAGAMAALSKDDLNPTLLETTIRFAMANRAARD